MNRKVSAFIIFIAVSVFLGNILVGGITPTLPDDDPQMRDLIQCWQGPGNKKEWRSWSDGQVEVSDGGVIRFSNNGHERVLIYSECLVTYDTAPIN